MNSLIRDTVLSPVYFTESPNLPIQLYKGQLELEQGNLKISTNGIVELVWLRSPKVKFSFTHTFSSSESAILLKNGKALVHGLIHIILKFLHTFGQTFVRVLTI